MTEDLSSAERWNVRGLAAASASLLLLAGCQSPEQSPEDTQELSSLLHTRVEAEGPLTPASPVTLTVVRNAEPGKYTEISAPLEEDAADASLKVLGTTILLNASTRFEDAERVLLPIRPELRAGRWVRVWATPEGDRLVAHRVRLSSPRKRFRLEGDLLPANAQDPTMVSIGGLAARVSPTTDLSSPSTESSPKSLAKGPLAQQERNDQHLLPYTVNPIENLYFGGELLSRTAVQDNYDLDYGEDSDRWDTRLRARLSSVYLLGDGGSFALATGEALYAWQFREGADNQSRQEYELLEGFVYLADTPVQHVSVQAGRQYFDEPREWLYGLRLDGVRVYVDFDPFQFQISASTGPDYLAVSSPRTEDITNYIYLLKYRRGKNGFLEAYVIDRRDQDTDTETEFSPLLYGLRSYDAPSVGLRHWLELARAEGVDGFNTIDGYGVDAGATYVFDTDLRPSVTAGYALGTGNRGNRPDHEGFRQSGLQFNDGKFGGVTPFRYYGEVLRPELANLFIWTVGVGVRPWGDVSLDLVAHGYRQDEASDAQLTVLRAEPNGSSRDLGRELDLIIGYRPSTLFRTMLVLGAFDPGDAFDPRDRAYGIRLDIRFRF
jgi:hypothetical protein